MPWNNNGGNIPAARVTRIRLIPGPEAAAQDNTSHVQNVLPETQGARAENRAHSGDILPGGRTDTRTLILNCLIALVIINFVLNILILRHILNIRFL